MQNAYRLIVGLGNHGQQYENTRHNAGFWWLDKLSELTNYQITGFSIEKKFSSLMAQVQFKGEKLLLCKPMTYMNRSGSAVRAVCQFYSISPEQVLLIHDELDLAPGVIKLKVNGGHGGHNGLSDTISHLHSKEFTRLRIGIGHPGQRHQVSDYVLHSPSKQDALLIEQAIERSFEIFPLLLAGNIDNAMNILHRQ